MKIIYVFLILCLSFVSCKQNDEAAVAESDSTVQSIRLSSPGEKMSAVAVDDAGIAAPGAVIEQKIIKEGSLRFETANLAETHTRVITAVNKHQGIVQNDIEGKDYESLFRNLIVRIPSDNFDAFLLDIGKGVRYFDRKEITARDVTEEYIDIDARLKAKKMLEARYLELLKKAGKVSEMLEIEKQLAAIREEIEAKEGQLRYMQSRIAMSTVSIEFYKKTALESGVTVSYGSKMWNAIKSGFNGISGFFIGVLYMWPFIIILVVLIYFLRRRFRRKKTN